MTKARPKANSRQARGGGRGAGYAPAKLRAARGVALRPGLVIGVAAVAALGLLIALGAGGRMSRTAPSLAGA